MLWQEKGCCGKSVVCENNKGNQKCVYVCVCVCEVKKAKAEQKEGTFNDVQLHLMPFLRRRMYVFLCMPTQAYVTGNLVVIYNIPNEFIALVFCFFHG